MINTYIFLNVVSCSQRKCQQHFNDVFFLVFCDNDDDGGKTLRKSFPRSPHKKNDKDFFLTKNPFSSLNWFLVIYSVNLVCFFVSFFKKNKSIFDWSSSLIHLMFLSFNLIIFYSNSNSNHSQSIIIIDCFVHHYHSNTHTQKK